MKRLTRTTKRWYKPHRSIEPTIGHLKAEHRMNRNYLKGKIGGHINALLAAAGYNFAKLVGSVLLGSKQTDCWLKSWIEITSILSKIVNIC